jgi:chromatin remodeling complex protein RSC6
MDYIYKVSVGVDMLFGKENVTKTEFSIKIWKYKIKNETNLNYILVGESERVKKDEICKIKDGLLKNSTRNIRYFVWLIDNNDISIYKTKIIDQIYNTINNYKNQLNILETAMSGEIKVQFDDRSSYDEIEKPEITSDMF